MQEFVDRFRGVSSKSAQVQSKVKQIERIEKVEKPAAPRRPFRFQIPQPPRIGQRALVLEGIQMAYGKNVVYRDLNLTVERGERTVLLDRTARGNRRC